MNRPRNILVLFAACIAAGFLMIYIVRFAQALSPNDPDYIAIYTTLRTYADIKDEALYTLDDSRLVEVLANDPRGGLVDPYLVKSVQIMTERPDLRIEAIGFLDVEQARWAFERKVKQLYDEAIASGAVEAPTPPPYNPAENPLSIDVIGTDRDPRTHWRPSPRIVPEVRALEKATGLGARLPVPRPAEIRHTGFEIVSISVSGDMAIAMVDWEYGLCEDILVKKDGSWYLVGHKIIEWHAG